MNRDDDMTGNEDQRHVKRWEKDAATKNARRQFLANNFKNAAFDAIDAAKETEARQKQLRVEHEERVKQWK